MYAGYAGTIEGERITDFTHADHDRVNLAAFGPLHFIAREAFSGTAGERRYAAVGGDTQVAIDTDGDRKGDVFLKLTGSIALVAADFVLAPGSTAAPAFAHVADPFGDDAPTGTPHPWSLASETPFGSCVALV